ncbi:MAG: hypothetical protein GY795_10745 [Desulfobacterales bacterium]|nr:hypothetical protein [Desulfobacterales bacterium]
MMILNNVQERLIDELMDYAKIKYPDVGIQTITESPAGTEHVWVIIQGIDWNDEDKSMDFMEYLSVKQEDILVEYGYPISLLPISMPEDNI